TLKDVAGGYGTVFRIGQSPFARGLEFAKRRVADLPSPVLGYIARAAEDAGHTVGVHSVRRGAAGHDPLPDADFAVVLSSIVDANAEREVLGELRRRGVPAVVVGAYASAHPEFYEGDAHAVVVGEPEALGPALFDVDATGIRDVGSVADLDALPFPSPRAFPVREFRYAFLSHTGVTLPVSGARGCTFGCGYCPWRVTAPFRQRSPESIAREVESLIATHGARAIAFRDPLWNFDRDRSLELADRLAPLGVRWSAEMRADRLDEPLLARLARAGLRSMEIGVESVDREMLKRERRAPPSAEQITDVIATAKRHGIRVITNFMFGLPDDTREGIRASVGWAKELNPFAVQFTVATPYPGTTLETRTRGRLRVLAPEARSGWEPVFEHPSLRAEELRALREWAYVSFHFRPRYVFSFASQAVRSLIEDLRSTRAE
ncbi:MAG: radical SAM protein, partial [Myxococcales bacterium]|nr:radical SAM protein [Myxococcales bacterium]